MITQLEIDAAYATLDSISLRRPRFAKADREALLCAKTAILMLRKARKEIVESLREKEEA